MDVRDVPDDDSQLWVAKGQGTVALVPFRRGNRWGYLDRDGRIVITPQYRFAGRSRFGLAVVTGKIIDQSGKDVITLSNDIKDVVLCEDCFWFAVRGDGLILKWGLMDYDGKVLISESYSDVQPFFEGRAAVNRGAQWQFPDIIEGGKWGYVNRKGEEVISLRYQHAGNFHEGRAVVGTASADDQAELQPETTMKVIDHDGKPIFTVNGSYRGFFSNDLLAVRANGKTDYVERSGHTRFSVDGDGDMFSEGKAVLSGGERTCGIIDTNGLIVFETDSDIGEFHCSRASSSTNRNEIGFINDTGMLVIPRVYNEVMEFSNDVAIVHRGGYFNYREDAGGSWANGIWLLIDGTGEELAVIELDPKQSRPREAAAPPGTRSDPNIDD